MANDPQAIRFAKNGLIAMAKTSDGADLPTDVGDGSTVPTGYTSFGYVDESGVTITPSIETDPVNAWQSAVPVLYNVKSAAFQVKATLMETNAPTTELFFGTSWVEDDTTPGLYRLDLSSNPELMEFSLVVDWEQSTKNYRCVIPRAMVSDRGAITLQRTDSQKYELTIDAMDSAGSLGYVLTNDTNVSSGTETQGFVASTVEKTV